MNGQTRKNIKIGALVSIVLKKDQPTGKRTEGHVKRILTSSPTHPHGIKVMLQEGDQVGRVQEILDEKLETPKKPAPPKPGEEIRPGRYRHFKGGEYRVLFVATHSESLEPMVVYQALYGERGYWARPASMWNETVKREGTEVARFTYLGE